MDPAGFLGVAENLWASDDEAERRTAIGRYYYAVYNRLALLFDAAGKKLPEFQSHVCARQYVRGLEERIAEVKGAAGLFKNLWGNRTHADYEMTVAITPSETAIARKRALELISMLDAVSEGRLIGALRALAPCDPKKR